MGITTNALAHRRVFIRAAGAVLAAHALASAAQTPPAASAPEPALRNGSHDFDFEFGEWRVRHRTRRAGQDGWNEFTGTCRTRALIDGSANIEEHTFVRPAGITHGIALRTYDAKTAQWAIWWVDGRDPHGTLDPPVKGRFENGVGTFFSDYVADGKTMRVRFVWSHITARSARWEQASSADGGKTWEVNWVMEFERTA